MYIIYIVIVVYYNCFTFIFLPGLSNRFSWMQGMYPLNGQELLLFKSSVSFIDHLQEFLSGILTACVLVIPPFNELKENLYSIIDFLQVW